MQSRSYRNEKVRKGNEQKAKEQKARLQQRVKVLKAAAAKAKEGADGSGV